MFAAQLKTVISEVIEKDYITEDGTVIDAIFGNRSIDDRIVNSAYIIGTTNTLLEVITKKACDLYFKETN